MIDPIVIVYSSIVALIIGGLIGGFLYKSMSRQQDIIYTTLELEEERHRRKELESALLQARQEVAQLSRENKHISGTLTQTSQRNEQFSNTLTQENHAIALEKERENRDKVENALQQTQQEIKKERENRERLERAVRQTQQKVEQLSREKEQLFGALTQESRYRETVERKLAFSGTSGYPILLNELYAAKHLKTDIQKRDYLQELQGAAGALWHEYQGTDISPDYSRMDYQEAYLLCYFLPYSQPVPYLLNQLVLRKEFPYQLPETGVLTATFFGCGPGPELLGLMRYLRSFQASLCISAALLDRETWAHSRRIVFQHLLDRAWDPENYDIQEFKTDIAGSSEVFLPADSEEWVKRSELIVIQNCLNERRNATSERSIENLKCLVEKMKTGAVMLIIERGTYVRKLLGEFRYILQEEFRGRIHVSSKIEGVEKITPILEVIPEELEVNFLRELQANAINSVEFTWIAISKMPSGTESPV